MTSLRARLGAFAALGDALASGVARVAAEALLWPGLLAVALASGVSYLGRGSWRALLAANRVPPEGGVRMLAGIVAAAVAVGIVHGTVLLVRRRRSGCSGGLETVARVNRRLLPLLALPLVGALSQRGLETESPKETFALVLLAAAAAGAGAYAWASPWNGPGTGAPAPSEPDRRRERLPRALAALAVAGIGVAYGGYFGWLSVLNHHAVKTRILDLGLYDNIFYQSIHGRPLACSFLKAGTHASAHFDPLLVLLSPLYLFHQGPETLLVLQAAWVALGVVPLYLLAHATLARRLPAVVLVAMYALHPALQGATLYEFHSLTLIVPLALALLCFLEAGAMRGYSVALALALLCREDISLLVCFVGAYAVTTGKPRAVRAGWVTVVLSLTYLVVVKRFFMTSPEIFMVGKDSYSYAFYYEGLIPNGDGVRGLVTSILTNPVFVLRTVWGEPKVLYLLALFVPLLFLPFVARPGRVLLLYGLLFSLLASNPIVTSPYFQYSSLVVPFAFAVTPAALRRIETGGAAARLGLDGVRLAGSLLLAALVASVLCSWKLGGVVKNDAFRWGMMSWSLTGEERETHRWIRENAGRIPEEASVAATQRVGPHVSSRREAFIYPERTDAAYLFVHEEDLDPMDLGELARGVQAGELAPVARREAMAIYRRIAPGPAPEAAASPSAPRPPARPPAPPGPP